MPAFAGMTNGGRISPRPVRTAQPKACAVLTLIPEQRVKWALGQEPEERDQRSGGDAEPWRHEGKRRAAQIDQHCGDAFARGLTVIGLGRASLHAGTPDLALQR